MISIPTDVWFQVEEMEIPEGWPSGAVSLGLLLLAIIVHLLCNRLLPGHSLGPHLVYLHIRHS